MNWGRTDRPPLAAPSSPDDSEDETEGDKAAAAAAAAAGSSIFSRGRWHRRRRQRRCRIAHDAEDDYPAFLSETPRTIAHALVVFGLGASAVHLALTGTYEIAGLAARWPGGSAAEALGDDFRLYKNSRFAACAASMPSPSVNCTLLEADLDHPWRLDPSGVGVPRDHYFLTGARYQLVVTPPTGAAAAAAAADEEAGGGEAAEAREDAKLSWCDLVACLAGWKVIPSTPRVAALGPTALTAWWSLLITAISTFGALRGLVARTRTPAQGPGDSDGDGDGGGGYCCAPAGLVDRALLAWEAAQLGFWWWAVPASLGGGGGSGGGNGNAATGRPSPPLTLTGWLVPWVLAVKCGVHPWSCTLSAPTRRRLAAFLYAVAAVQWAATVYARLLLLRRRQRQNTVAAFPGPPSYYDCHAAGIATAPGAASPCPADRLCASPWLFRNPDFAGMDETAALALYDVVVSLDTAAFPLYLGFRAAASVLARRLPRLWKRLRNARLSPFRSGDGRVESRRLLLGLFLIRGYLHLLYALPFFVSAMDSLVDREKGFATVAYDFGCRAVHVGVSPKHFYLDIDAFDRGLRVVRQWFNA